MLHFTKIAWSHPGTSSFVIYVHPSAGSSVHTAGWRQSITAGYVQYIAFVQPVWFWLIFLVNFKSLGSWGHGRDSAIGTATRYGLNGPWIDSRSGATFLATVQTDPGDHSASCTKGTGSLTRGYSREGAWCWPAPSSSGPSRPVLRELCHF